jgi:ferrochelatase
LSSAAETAGEFDAFLLLSFGGPEGPDEVLPFLRNVTRGRGIPDERLAAVAEHYYHFGGVSPINAQNRALLVALQAEFANRSIELPLYWGNRNWDPLLPATVDTMRADGIRRALVLATSATGSYSGCRQYREKIAAAQLAVGADAPELVKLRHYFDHPGFIAANADGVRAALAQLPPDQREDARLVFTAHSIPVSMNESAGPSGGLYLAEHRETARLVAQAVRGPGAEFDLVWHSRSGPPSVPWLEPDISDHLRSLAAAGHRAVVVSPTGFVSDHLEVAWDLDVEARDTAAELGLEFARAAAAGTHPAFVAMIAELVLEQTANLAPRASGELGLCGVDCPAFCCPAPSRPVSPAVGERKGP